MSNVVRKKKTTDSLFLNKTEKEYVGYKNIRDMAHNNEIKTYLEELWKKYSSYAEKDFQKEMQQSKEKFNQRFWEMFLACSLLDCGMKLIPQKEQGRPDICIEDGDRKIWIECIAPEVGEEGNANTVPEIYYEKLRYDENGNTLPLTGMPQGVPEDQINLRYTQAIRDKYEGQILRWVKNDLAKENDCILIAVNSGNISSEAHDGFAPTIAQICYGIGNMQMHMALNEKGIIEHTGSSYTHKDRVNKQSGNGDVLIETDIFRKNKYPYLSGIVFSYANLAISPFEDELYVLHNPFAINPLPRGFIKTGAEYWLEEIEKTEDEYITFANLKKKEHSV